MQHPAGHILNLAGRTLLRELMVWLKLCRVVLTNHAGPMPVALGVSVVALFGSTSAELAGPISAAGLRPGV
jgi:ADP-heptose:LPS heptosyltransferase